MKQTHAKTFKSRYDHPGLTPIQRQCMTKFTRTGERSLDNKKPFRTKAQKARAQWYLDKGMKVPITEPGFGDLISFHPPHKERTD